MIQTGRFYSSQPFSSFDTQKYFIWSFCDQNLNEISCKGYFQVLAICSASLFSSPLFHHLWSYVSAKVSQSGHVRCWCFAQSLRLRLVCYKTSCYFASHFGYPFLSGVLHQGRICSMLQAYTASRLFWLIQSQICCFHPDLRASTELHLYIFISLHAQLLYHFTRTAFSVGQLYLLYLFPNCSPPSSSSLRFSTSKLASP